MFDNMLKNVEAVIFDMDGTLVDSMTVWHKIDIEYIEDKGFDFPSDLPDKIDGMSFLEKAQYIKKHFNLEDSVDTIMEDWRSRIRYLYRNEIPMKAGANKFLDYLLDREIKMGIASSNSRELVDLVVDSQNLRKYIMEITTAGEVNKGKPAPDVYLETANRLGVSPSKCLVFEDVPNGIRAALNAGMRVCAIYDDFTAEHDILKRELAHYYIKDFNDLT